MTIQKFLSLRWLLLLSVFFLAVCVRFWKIEYMPFANDADEFAQILAGQSLLEYGMPISWSSFSHESTQWQKVNLEVPAARLPDPLVLVYIRPWFDHTFFVPMIMGGWAHALGYSFPSLPPAMLYRLPLLLVAAINLGLIFLLTRKFFGYWPALFSLTLASFSPMMIIGQRMVIPENFMTLFILLTLLFYVEKQQLPYLILTTILAGLTKMTGLIIVPIMFIALLSEKKYKNALLYAGASVGGVALLYLLYGASIDLTAFFAAMKDQSARLLGWSNPAFIFANPGLYKRPMLDFSYYVFLLLGLGSFLSVDTKEKKLLAATSLAMIVTIWATSGEQDMLGWYRIPLFSILAMAAGYHIKKQNYFLIIVLVMITILSNFGLVRYPDRPLPEALLLRVLIGSMLLFSFGLMYWVKKANVQAKILLCVLALFALQSFYIIDQYFDSTCKDRICGAPLVTFSQSIRERLLK